MRNFTSATDVQDIEGLIRKSLAYKASPALDRALGAGKRMGLVFPNPSMRTRLSTQIAATNLGMKTVVFNVGQDGWELEFEEGVIMNGTHA